MSPELSATMAATDGSHRIGAVLRGKYRLDRVLGAGGMATVYAATHRNGRSVAIKMLHADLARDASIRRRFLKEGYIANAIAHPGVVAVLDDDVADDGSIFVVMELLEGVCVADIVPAPLETGLGIAHELLDVLAVAHAAGVIHRDIKPENLFLTSEGRLKVLDFGIARLRTAARTIGNSTMGGVVIGTPGYMPREQALGRNSEIDGRSDLWAVGATLWRLLSGREPYEAATAEEVIWMMTTKPTPSLASVAPHVPRAIVAVIDRALALDAKDRWPDARAMQRAMAEAHLQSTGRPLQTNDLHATQVDPDPRRDTPAAFAPPSIPVEPPRRKRKAALRVATALLCVLAGTAIAKVRMPSTSEAAPVTASTPPEIEQHLDPPPAIAIASAPSTSVSAQSEPSPAKEHAPPPPVKKARAVPDARKSRPVTQRPTTSPPSQPRAPSPDQDPFEQP